MIKREAHKAGVEIKEVRLGEPAIPPEMLIGRLRQQLADQLGDAYKRETEAQKQRIETEQAKSTADEQPRLVAAQIAVQVADQHEAERAALGRAERQYLEEIARGQRPRPNVLGQDRVAMLQALDKALISLERKPELVQLVGKLVPNTVVTGSGLKARPPSSAMPSTRASLRHLRLQPRVQRRASIASQISAAMSAPPKRLHLADAGGRGDVDLGQVVADHVDADEDQPARLQVRADRLADLVLALGQRRWARPCRPHACWSGSRSPPARG